MNAKILLGSPVKQTPEILKEFLCSLSELDRIGFSLDCLFIDDNDADSSCILNSFTLPESKISIIKAKEADHTRPCSEYGSTHNWNRDLIERIAAIKNHILDKALEGDYTHLFLIDSDIVLHPQTIRQLLFNKKDIVANIFWTRFSRWDTFFPQVWQMDQRALYDPRDPQTKSKEYRTVKELEFVESLKEKGVFKVGGLGACTLIARNVLQSGVNFTSLYNLSFWGEDRSFCIRAATAGYQLFVDTHFPAYHIYRQSDLEGVAAFKQNGFDFSRTEKNLTAKEMCKKTTEQLKRNARSLLYKARQRIKYRSRFSHIVAENLKRNNISEHPPRITLSMVVGNERKNDYLKHMLEDCRRYIDSAVIIDDASTDGTAEMCARVLEGIPVKIVRNEESLFAEEHKLRKLQWRETISTNPDWILSLDADEVFEKRFAVEIKTLLASDKSIDVYNFRRFDMWNETRYREDTLWCGHLKHEAYIMRYIPGFEYFFSNKNHHCGRLPRNLKYLKSQNSDLRLKHLGWACEERRREKYQRYMEIDGDGIHGDVNQYQSILDETPDLIGFME